MAVTVTASLLTTGAAAAQPSPTSSPSAKETVPLTPVDAARAEAKQAGRQVEIPSLHTEASTTYATNDGKTLSTEFFTDPIRFKQGDAWRKVDTTLVAENGTIKPRATKAGLTLSAGGGTDLLTAPSQRDGATVKISAPQKLPAPKLSGDRAEYANAYGPGIDLAVIATPTGFRQEAIIRQRPVSPLKLPVPIQLPAGLAFDETSKGKLALHDSTAKAKHRTTEIPAPLLTDSGADFSIGEEGQVGKVATAVEKTAAGQTLIYKPDDSFLADPDVTYPVTLVVADDVIWTQLPNANDTFINNSSYQNGYANSGAYHLQAGMTNSGTVRWRTYIRFEDIPADSPLRGGRVTNADLVLWNIDSNDCGLRIGSGITARRVTERWDVSTLTWSNQPNVTSEDANIEYGAYKPTCTRGYMDYEHDLIHYVNGIAQDWADGQPNYGFQLTSGNESENTNWRAYRSKEYGEDGAGSHGPKLVIGYEPAVVEEHIATVWGMSSSHPTSEIVDAAMAAVAVQDPPSVPREQMDAAAHVGDGYTETQAETMTIPEGLTPEQVEEFLEGPRPTQPPTAPSVVSTGPADAQTNVALNTQIKVTFNEAIRGEAITVKNPQGAPVAGEAVLQPGDDRLVFTPSEPLTQNTTYTAEVSGAQNAMDATMSPYTWTFTTGETSNPPPTKTISLPVQSDTWLDDQGSVGPSGPTLWVGAYSEGNLKAIERAYLAFDTSALAGKTITDAKLKLWNSAGSSYGCGDGESGIKAQRVTAAWNAATLRWDSQPSATDVGEVFATDPSACTSDFLPPSDVAWNWSVTGIVQAWASGETNRGLVLRGANESASAPLYDRGFDASEAGEDSEAHPPTLEVTYTDDDAGPDPTPTPTPDTTPPTVLKVEPAEGAENVPSGAQVKVTFSEPVTDVRFSLQDIFEETEILGDVTMSAGNTVLTFTPDEQLDFYYYAEVTGARDVAGNDLQEPFGWTFAIGSFGQPLQKQAESGNIAKTRDIKPSVEKLWTRSLVTKGSAVTPTTTPYLMVKVSDPLKRPAAVEVEVLHDPEVPAQGKGLIWSGSSLSTPSRYVGIVQVPAGKVKGGWKVRWRARAVANGVTSEWSDYRSVAIDLAVGEPASPANVREKAATATAVHDYSNFNYDRIKDNDDCIKNARSAYGYRPGSKVLLNPKGYARNRFSYCVAHMPGLVRFKTKNGRPVLDSAGNKKIEDAVWFPVVMIGKTYQGSRTIDFDLWVKEPIFDPNPNLPFTDNYFEDKNFTFGMIGSGYPHANACRGVSEGNIRTSYSGNADHWDDKTVSFRFDSYVDSGSAGADNRELIGTCTTRTTLGISGLQGYSEAQEHPQQSIRCDSATYVGFYQGCIFDHETPSIALKEGMFSEAYSHISTAYLAPSLTHPKPTDHRNAWPTDISKNQPKNIPGFTKQNLIHRLYEYPPDDLRNGRNRGRSQSACRWSFYDGWDGKGSFPWVAKGQQCDEFPFASTYEGSWVWWQEDPPKDVRDYKPRGVNYTVKLIPRVENRDWGGRAPGGILYYYANDRILDKDAFFLRLYDKGGKRVNPD
ncbi:DNRLRE domain-containing protein [Nonomuraea sp. NPDC049750]|uniref:DNRLRE domain-containing protein n=1 Tax=Nonomuraea sp. NPDC049750 TaxID=3154738 RepID=UPI0033EC3B73